MQKIIDAQGPSNCRTELGNLTFDVKAGSDGVVSGIDCLQLNRLARTAGAPHRQGRRHQAVQENRRPRRAAANRSTGFTPSISRSTIWRRPARRSIPATRSKTPTPLPQARRREQARHSEPAIRRRRCQTAGLAAWPSLAGNRVAPVSRRGNARDGRPAPPSTTIIYASLDQPNDKLIAILFAAEALRRDGRKAARAAGALSLLHAPGHSLPRRRSDQPEGGRPADRGNGGSRHHGGRPPSSHHRHQGGVSRHRGRKPVGHAGDRECAARGRDRSRQPSWSVRTRSRGPG